MQVQRSVSREKTAQEGRRSAAVTENLFFLKGANVRDHVVDIAIADILHRFHLALSFDDDHLNIGVRFALDLVRIEWSYFRLQQISHPLVALSVFSMAGLAFLEKYVFPSCSIASGRGRVGSRGQNKYTSDQRCSCEPFAHRADPPSLSEKSHFSEISIALDLTVFMISSCVCGINLSRVRKFCLPRTANRVGVTARTVALRGASLISAISPKYCPFDSVANTRWAPSACRITFTSPLWMK